MPGSLCSWPSVAPAAADNACSRPSRHLEGREPIDRAGRRPHHPSAQGGEPRLTSVPFTLVIDKQEGRRFSGTFSSPRHSETVIAVVSRSGTIYMVDDDGYNVVTMLSPDRMEMCYLHLSSASRIASCTELSKQPK